MNPQDYIGKMYQVNFSGRHKEFVIISEVIEETEYFKPMFRIYWQKTMKYELYSIDAVLCRIKLMEWVEV